MQPLGLPSWPQTSPLPVPVPALMGSQEGKSSKIPRDTENKVNPDPLLQLQRVVSVGCPKPIVTHMASNGTWKQCSPLTWPSFP